MRSRLRHRQRFIAVYSSASDASGRAASEPTRLVRTIIMVSPVVTPWPDTSPIAISCRPPLVSITS